MTTDYWYINITFFYLYKLTDFDFQNFKTGQIVGLTIVRITKG